MSIENQQTETQQEVTQKALERKGVPTDISDAYRDAESSERNAWTEMFGQMCIDLKNNIFGGLSSEQQIAYTQSMNRFYEKNPDIVPTNLLQTPQEQVS